MTMAAKKRILTGLADERLPVFQANFEIRGTRESERQEAVE